MYSAAIMRHPFSAAVLLLAACGRQAPDNAAFSRAIAEANAQAADDGRIVCAPAGSDAFARACTLDRTQSAQGLIITVRRPDGGFHRLLAVKDGRGLIAADGAEPAKVSIVGDGEIEVAIGGDRFRLPATIKRQGKQ